MRTTTLAATAVALAAAVVVVFYLWTGVTAAAYVGMSTPLLILLAVSLMRRRPYHTVQVKTTRLARAVERYNDLAQRHAEARAQVGDDLPLPGLDQARRLLGPALRRAPDAPRPFQVRSRGVEHLDVQTIRSFEDAIDDWSRELDETVDALARSQLEGYQRNVDALHERQLVSDATVGDGVEGIRRSVEAYREGLANVRGRMEAIRDQRRDVHGEEQQLQEVEAMANNNDLGGALAGLVAVAQRLASRVGPEFERNRLRILEHLDLPREAGAVALMSPELQEEHGALRRAIDQAANALRFEELPELQARVETLLYRCVQDLGGDPEEPQWDVEWFEELANRRKADIKTAKANQLYKEIRPRITECLDSKGVVRAVDLKLRDADGVFQAYVDEHPRAVRVGEELRRRS